MSKDKKLGVALTKTLCSICAITEMDGDIVLNTVLTESNAKKVEDMHGKVVAWSKEPCPACQDMKSKGFVLIGVDEDRTDDVTNPWRTGNIWCVKQEAAEIIFAGQPVPESGVAFVDIKVCKQVGLPM